MALVKTISFTATPSASTDVVKNKLYYVPTGTPLDYNAPFVDLGTTLSGDLNTLLPALPEGNYDFGIAAVDATGNESDLTVQTNVPFDVTPPAPVTNFVIS